MSTTETNADRLVRKVEADTSHLLDPLMVAAEAARHVSSLDHVNDTKTAVQALVDVMPTNTSVLERGLSIGMVVALQAMETPK